MNKQKEKASLTASSMAAVLLCAMFFSCDNEEFFEWNSPEITCDNICFGISSDKNVLTRSNVYSHEGGYTTGQFVLRSEDSTDTLCVRTIVYDGICSSDFENKRTVTRGMPVTKENFYDAFHILAYWKKEGVLVEEQFYMNEDVIQKGNNLWSSINTYYWPGAGHSLKFHAWAPTNAEFTSTPSTPTSTILEYTVPENAIEQKDIVVASPEETLGNYNKAQSLTFMHICTAVRFEIGNQMQPGTIKSIALKGVRHKGSYDMESGMWNLNESTSDFLQSLNMPTTGTETSGTDITSADRTFMMLPQSLPSNAGIEVVFINNASEERNLTASIAGTEWKMGTTVTYKLSITPEYECDLKFMTTQDNIPIKDCHYDFQEIEIGTGGKYTGPWSLETDREWATIRLYPDMTETDIDLYHQGYWCENDKGSQTLSGTSISPDGVKVIIYLYENINETDEDLRNVTLNLYATDNGKHDLIDSRTIKQFEPIWNAGLAYERIEEYNGPFPWGFCWEKGATVIYSAEYVLFRRTLFNIAKALGWIDRSYVSDMGIGGFFSTNYVTLNIGDIPALDENTAISGNGLINTSELLNNNGITAINNAISLLESWGLSTENGITQPTDFAARMILFKNKFNRITSTSGGTTISKPELTNEGLQWYLPSKDEISQLHTTQGDNKLIGPYWTSSAVPGNYTDSYCYASDGTISQAKRTETKRIRATRQK